MLQTIGSITIHIILDEKVPDLQKFYIHVHIFFSLTEIKSQEMEDNKLVQVSLGSKFTQHGHWWFPVWDSHIPCHSAWV